MPYCHPGGVHLIIGGGRDAPVVVRRELSASLKSWLPLRAGPRVCANSRISGYQGHTGRGAFSPRDPHPPPVVATQGSLPRVCRGSVRASRFVARDYLPSLPLASRRVMELARQLRLHRLRTPRELVFPGSTGQPIDYHNWRARVWAPLLQRVSVTGTFHMLRHFFVTALIQSGVNAKVAQTLAGHHSASFTLDQYADAVPQQLEEAGEKVSTVLLEASGSILVAEAKQLEVRSAQVIDALPDSWVTVYSGDI